MRMSLTQRLAKLRDQYAKAHASKKAADRFHRKMVELTTRQLRREIREDRKAS